MQHAPRMEHGPALVPDPAAPIRESVAAAESGAGAHAEVAVAALDVATGELATGTRGHDRFLAASLAKLVVAVDILHRARYGGLAVTAADRDLLRAALGPSDDGAMNILWVRFDGPGAADRLTNRLGLGGTAAPRDQTQWGEMTTTAADHARLWLFLLTELTAADRAFLLDALTDPPATAADGFRQAYGLLAPVPDGRRFRTAAKQGWMCCPGGRAYLHSAGVAGADRTVVIVVLTRLPPSLRWDPARAEVTRIMTAALAPLG